MSHFRRAASALLVSGAVVTLAEAQAPPNPVNPSSTAGARANPPRAGSQAQPSAAAQAKPRRKSIVHHYPYPYPAYYHGDLTAGYRNPGGVGRYAEYYPPGDRFQVADQDPVRVASFDRGGGPNWDEQSRRSRSASSGTTRSSSTSTTTPAPTSATASASATSAGSIDLIGRLATGPDDDHRRRVGGAPTPPTRDGRPQSSPPTRRHSSSTPARALVQRSMIVCWMLGGTGSYDLNSIVNEPRPPVMLFRSVA